ncbi:hypothetical protein NK214_23010, partial [Chromobacterium sp. S0633]|nr:hypothetical protein [Chromobacterium sp. S0633]
AKQQVDTQAALVRQYQGTVKLDQGAADWVTAGLQKNGLGAARAAPDHSKATAGADGARDGAAAG